MKKQILAALKTKFEGVSEVVLDAKAEKLAKGITSEDEVTTAIEGVTIQQIIESYSDRRANQAANTAVENYKKNNPQPTPEPQPTPTPAPPQHEASEEVQQLKASFAELQAQMAALNKQKATEGRKAQVKAITERLPQSLQKAYERIDVAAFDEEGFEAFKGELSSEVDNALSGLKQRGATIKPPYNTPDKGAEQLTPEQLKAIEESVKGKGEQADQPF